MTDTRKDFEARFMSALLALPEGRIFVGLLIEETGFLRSSARDSPTAEDTYYREGERNVGQRVFEMAAAAGVNPLECMKAHGEWLADLELCASGLPKDEDEEVTDYGGTD